ncbi:MAG TPA: hypothetical protein VK324_15290, partial [Tepidisphaeraceae bacterium]|nr:hypothetical protein [Tepidisphaeraceae bacterium]
TNISQRGFLTQSLAGQVVSEAAKFNGDVVWQALTEVSFKAGDVVLGKTIQQPGGTMYIPGSGAIYYPHGSEASATRRDMFYLTDAFAHVLDLERANPAFSAEQWMRLRAQDMLAMQARHADGHLYAPGEHSSWAATEQMPSWQMSDAYLAVWLDAQNKVSPEGNWIPHVFVENPGFEKVNLSAGTLKRFNVTGGIDGWQLLSGDGQKAGVTNFAGHGVVGAAFDEARFNGNHKALWINANGGTVPPVIGQALGVAIDDDLRYVLSLDIASLGEAGNGIESYVVQLLADGVLLSEAVEGINGAPTLLDGRFVTVSLDFDASAGLPAGVVPGVSALQLRLINPVMYSGPLSAQTIFDNVRLTAVPVPEPVSSIGVACLALRRRRTV